MPDPVERVPQVDEEIRLGMDPGEALFRLQKRVPVEDMGFFCTAIKIQRGVGGNLAEVLDRLAEVIRERFKILSYARVLSAQHRWAAICVGLSPAVFAVVFELLHPGYFGALKTNPIGPWLVAPVSSRGSASSWFGGSPDQGMSCHEPHHGRHPFVPRWPGSPSWRNGAAAVVACGTAEQRVAPSPPGRAGLDPVLTGEPGSSGSTAERTGAPWRALLRAPSSTGSALSGRAAFAAGWAPSAPRWSPSWPVGVFHIVACGSSRPRASSRSR
jgi:hypothetical protein